MAVTSHKVIAFLQNKESNTYAVKTVLCAYNTYRSSRSKEQDRIDPAAIDQDVL
jgi:hypothetical protein